ncbi:hypothetical protein [uncultured Mailhella sp.]|uniref:hypothetical protein n=1 Tax=uncultured Mailhella sp. TaxID=1981031 RepID=UPI0025CD927F|nr:hypothetical protein [uncultured Mailhella sp.]
MWINTLCTGYIIAIFFCLIDFFFCFDPRVWKKLLKEKKVKFFLALRFFGMLFSGAVGEEKGHALRREDGPQLVGRQGSLPAGHVFLPCR